MTMISMPRKVGTNLVEQAAEQDGHTVIEAVVALALLMTVLVPVGAGLSYFIMQRKNEHQFQAQALAQRVMEETLLRQDYVNDDRWISEQTWRVVRTIHMEGNRVTVRVQIYRRAQSTPLADLMTVRLRGDLKTVIRS